MKVTLNQRKVIVSTGITLLAIPVVAFGVFLYKKPQLDNEVVTISKYKGVKLRTMTLPEVTDEEVNTLYDNLKRYHAESVGKEVADIVFSDEYISEMTGGQFTSESDFLEELRTNISTGNEVMYEEGLGEQIDDIIHKNTKYHQLPKERLDSMVEELREIYEDSAKDAGKDILDYMNTMYGLSTKEEYEAYLLKNATFYVGIDVAYEQIAIAEGLIPSDEELEKKIHYYQQTRELTREQVLSKYTRDGLRTELIREKVYEFIKENSKPKK